MFNFNLSDGQLTGFEAYFLQSEEWADEIIAKFKQFYDGGDPNALLSDIAESMNISDKDLLSSSRIRIEKEIADYLRRI